MVKKTRDNVFISVKRYKLKQLPYIIATQQNRYLSNAKEMLAFWLSFLDVIEKSTLEALAQYNIDGQDVVYWLGYAKKLVKEGKRLNFLTILIEYLNALDITIKRNPSFSNYPDLLMKIQEEVSRAIGTYVHLWYGFYDLAFYDISIYLE
jgi:hypothetical protein